LKGKLFKFEIMLLKKLKINK